MTPFTAPVVKLVDTQDSGSCASNGVMVRLHSGAPLRGVAQPGRALRSGRRSRWFESSRPDQTSPYFT